MLSLCHWQYKLGIAMSLVYLFIATQICRAESIDSSTVLSFDFNDHHYEEKYKRTKVTALGVSLVEDRFGNERSAVFFNGHIHSYLNLGTSPILKPKRATISLWVNLTQRIYAGKGAEFNPIFLLKNSTSDDFFTAYGISYEGSSKRFNATSSKDSLNESIVHSVNEVKFSEWYHLVLVADNHSFAFYVNGKLQGKCVKNFETQFLASDSVMIGHSANKKNERYSQGIIDDIQIYHRALNEQEVLALYHAPNPNRYKVYVALVLKIVVLIGLVLLMAYWLVWRRRKALLRSQEKLDANRKLKEMEIRTLKAQMNPHFIFNALNSIQQLIMGKENAQAEIYLSKFSKLIREILETNTKENITIKEEADILNGYLEMESLRFGQSFSYVISVDGRIVQESTKIPHMMVQPFVENAIWHGLLPKQNNRELSITFQYDSDKTILCIVDDNGVGRDKSIRKKTTFKKKSLALSFVQQRLELMSDMMTVKVRVELIDKKNEAGESLGTRVLIVLPILE